MPDEATEKVPVFNPDETLGYIPQSQLEAALAQGYSLASPQQIHAQEVQQKYGSTTEQAKAFLENAAEGAIPFGMTTAVERMAGVNPEDIRGRKEANPITSGVGQVAGFVGSQWIPYIGQANLVREAGALVKGATGLKGVLGAAARLGTEGAVMQGGDELSKMYSEDPNQTMQTALSHIGMAAAVTPAIGLPVEGAGQLWEATAGKKLSGFLEAAQKGDTEELSKIGEMAREKILGRLEKYAKHAVAGSFALHGNIPGAVLAELTGDIVTKKSKDAVKFVWERLLSKADSQVTPAAFKSLVQMTESAYSGLRAIGDAAKVAVTGIGSIAAEPLSDKVIKQLERASDSFQSNPELFIDVGHEIGSMEPDHASAQGATVARAMEVIAKERPQPLAKEMLDAEPKVPAAQQAQYQRTLQIVENPLSILKNVQLGTLTPKDLSTFSYVFPDLHRLVSDKLVKGIIEAKTAGTMIPYKNRLGLAAFLGMPLDSTMTPEAIRANQANMAPPGPGSQTQPNMPHNSGAAPKSPKMASSAAQASEARRIMR